MKKSLLTLLLLVLVTGAFGQSNKSIQKDWYRNEIFLEPFRFFEGTFALGYQRNFSHSAVSIMPSVTLKGESLLGLKTVLFRTGRFWFESIYKVYFTKMPKWVQVLF